MLMMLLVLLLVVFFLIFLVLLVVFTLLLLLVVVVVLLLFLWFWGCWWWCWCYYWSWSWSWHVTDTSQTREGELLRLNACLARGVQGGGGNRGAEILSLLQPPPACTQRAHNAKVQTILVACTEGVLNVYKATTRWSSSDSSLQTASAQIQNLARKITMYTHSHKFCVH